MTDAQLDAHTNRRTVHFDDVFAVSGGAPLLVIGPRGSGRTNQLADLAERARASGHHTVVVPVRVDLGTTTLRGLIECVRAGLANITAHRASDTYRDAPNLQEALAAIVGGIPPDRPATVIVDDIDLLEPIYSAWGLAWLPRFVPAPARLIVSCASDADADSIRSRLAFVTTIIAHKQGTRPQRKEFEELLEGRLPPHTESCVIEVATLLAHARTGLTELELRDLVELARPEADVDRALSVLAPFLRASSGVLSFSRYAIQQAVRHRFAPTADLARSPYLKLAHYFTSPKWSRRMSDEALWHWIALRRADQVEALLCNPLFVEHLCKTRGLGAAEDDYARAIAAFHPETRNDERQRYLNDLLDYARERGPRGDAAPQPPISPAPLLQGGAEPSNHRLHSFANLLTRHRDFIHDHLERDGVLLQLAYNCADAAVCEVARVRIDDRPVGAPMLLRRRVDAAPIHTMETRWQRKFLVTTDQQRILSIGRAEPVINVWNAQTGERTSVLSREQGNYAALAVTPDGTRVVAGGGPGALYGQGMDFALHIWDLKSATALGARPGHTSPIRGIAMAPSGRWCISSSLHDTSALVGAGAHPGGGASTALLWDLADGYSRPFANVRQGVAKVAIAPDGRLVALIERSDGRPDSPRPPLRLFDAATGVEVMAILEAGDHATRALRFSPDGRSVVWFTSDVMSERVEFHVLDLVRGTHDFIARSDIENELAITPDARYLVSLGRRTHDHPPVIKVRHLRDGEDVALVLVVADDGLALGGQWCVVSGQDGNGNGDNLHVFDMVGLALGSACVTATWLYRHDLARWDNEATAACSWCGVTFRPPDSIITVLLENMERCDAALPPCLAVWKLDWNEAALETSCPSCDGALRFNPFIIDERERYP